MNKTSLTTGVLPCISSSLWRAVRLVGWNGLDEGLQLTEPGLYGDYGGILGQVELPPVAGVEDLRHQAAVGHGDGVAHTVEAGRVDEDLLQGGEPHRDPVLGPGQSSRRVGAVALHDSWVL